MNPKRLIRKIRQKMRAAALEWRWCRRLYADLSEYAEAALTRACNLRDTAADLRRQSEPKSAPRFREWKRGAALNWRECEQARQETPDPTIAAGWAVVAGFWLRQAIGWRNLDLRPGPYVYIPAPATPGRKIPTLAV